MKKPKVLIALIALFGALNLISCSGDTEGLDPSVLNPETPDCVAPSNLEVSDFINNTSIELHWLAAANEASWEVEYGVEGFVRGTGTVVASDKTTLMIDGLDPLNQYDFYLRAICGADSASAWVGPVSSSNRSCPAPTGLTVKRTFADPSVVNVNWAAGGTEQYWQIQYGAPGFSLGTGTIVNTNANTRQLTGITESALEFYVRAACGVGEGSEWTGPVTLEAFVDYAFLSATVDGEAHTGLMPYNYEVIGPFATVVNGAAGRELIIQGNSQPNNPAQNNVTEITLRIPESFWMTGTYDLESDATYTGVDPKPEVNLKIVNSTNSAAVNENEIPGSITITEFNPDTRRIKGTFTFSYEIQNGVDVTGPFEVTGGSFDFPVDPAAFE